MSSGPLPPDTPAPEISGNLRENHHANSNSFVLSCCGEGGGIAGGMGGHLQQGLLGCAHVNCRVQIFCVALVLPSSQEHASNFFWHRASGTTQWERPVLPTTEGDAAAAAASAEPSAAQANRVCDLSGNCACVVQAGGGDWSQCQRQR